VWWRFPGWNTGRNIKDGFLPSGNAVIGDPEAIHKPDTFPGNGLEGRIHAFIHF